MTLDHTVIEELLAVQALGGLDGEDLERLARELAAHGDCAGCRRLETGFAETAARLAFSLEPAPVEDAMVDRILAGEPATARPAAAQTVTPMPRSRSGSVRRWVIGSGIAAALALVAVIASSIRPGPMAISGASPSQQIVRFEGEGPGSLSMAYSPGEPGAVFWGRDMPELGPEQAFEIWMIQDGEPIGGGCVRPQDGTVALSVDADLGATELMAVTVEDASCPSAPTADPVMLAELPPVL